MVTEYFQRHFLVPVAVVFHQTEHLHQYFRNFVPSKSKNWEKWVCCHLHSLFLQWFELTYFWKVCQLRLSQLKFSTRWEKLVCWCELARGCIFQPAGMRVGWDSSLFLAHSHKWCLFGYNCSPGIPTLGLKTTSKVALSMSSLLALTSAGPYAAAITWVFPEIVIFISLSEN